MGRQIARDVEPGQVLEQLPGSLILRCATQEDTEPLAEFQRWVHYGAERPAPGNVPITRDLMKGGMPGFAVQDWTLVVDSETGEIVSTLYLVSQTWSYRGIEIPAGRVELVATHPDYRRRGLVRRQMQVVHEWSRRRGELMMGISGIPWYYRQFGYEMALEHRGGRAGPLDAMPGSLNGESAPVRLRPARETDLAWIAGLHERGTRRYLLSCVRGEAVWRYDLLGRSTDASNFYRVCVIEAEDGAGLGVLVHQTSATAEAIIYEVDEDSFDRTNSAVFRHLRAVADAHSESGERQDVAMILGSSHPAYAAAGELLPREVKPYAWYLRVPDLPAFLSHVAPVIEARLARSEFAGFSGSLRLNFIGSGLHLSLDHGRLAAIESWMPPQHDNRLAPRERDAMFPGLTVLQLLCGFRSVEDLEYAFPDCLMSSDKTRRLLNAMFPVEPSSLIGIA